MQMETTQAADRVGLDTDDSQFLTFRLGDEEYGVDILRVREIRGWSPVTRMPQSPEFVLGVLNLRGSIVPVIDLRRRFALDHADYTATTVTIVLSVQSSRGQRDMGIVVDAVSDVLQLQTAEIKAAPDFGTAVSTEFISGLASLESKMVMLLDVDRLLTIEELAEMNKVAAVRNNQETRRETS